ncbi:MAG: TonB-dependent receptor domain-containing protein, partial [Candidatus Aminicenantales bacterium]
TNPRGASFGTLVQVNYNAVEEVRVVALGSKAEYGSYSGAAIDVLTKSGSNAFHGTAAFYFEPVKWRRSNQPPTKTDLITGEKINTPYNGSNWIYVDPSVDLFGTPPEKDWEGNFTIGGPIIKDRIWFYGGFDYLYSAGKRPRWDLLQESWGRYADMKISAEPFTNHRAWVSYHFESNDYTGGSWGSQPEWDTSMTYGTATKNNTISAQWQWVPSSTTILTAKYLGFWTNDSPHVPDSAPDHPGYVNWWKWASYGINGAFPYIEGWRSNRQTIQADVSHFAEDFLGEHDIKFGVQFTKGRSNSLGGYFQGYINYLYPLRSTQYVQYMQSWYGDTGVVFYNDKKHLNPFMTVGTADSLGIFFDDQWSPTKRLTVNLGLRFDRMTTKYGEGEEYSPLTKPYDFGNLTVLRKRKGSGNIFDFKTISPRIGLTYSLTEDGKTVARASYGRYYLPLMVEYLRRFGPDMPLVTLDRYFYTIPFDVADANGDGEIDTVETRNAARLIYGMTPDSIEHFAPADTSSWTLNVDPNVKDQFTDQLTLNLEREIVKDFSISATFIYKHSANIFANIPINRATQKEWEYDRVPFTLSSGKTVLLYSIKWLDYDGNGVINGDDIHWISQNSSYKVVNMNSFDGKKAKRDYQGYQLVFNKRFSNRWQMLASLLYSHSSGMANRLFGNDMNAEGPMFYDNTWMGSLNYTINNMEGPLPFVPKFEFKLSGSYTVPYVELDLGARFRLHTGRPLWTLEEIPVRTEWGGQEGSVIGGGAGYIVGDPSDGLHYLPTQTILDLRAEKSFKLFNAGTVSVILDILNVFNADTPNSINNQWEFGRIGGIVDPRTFRLSFLYQF